MLEIIGPEFQCLKRQGRNSSVTKNRAGIPMLKRRAGISVVERIGPELQCL